MKKLRIGIIEILANSSADTMYSRIMRVNSASIMPQVLAVWHRNHGYQRLNKERISVYRFNA